VRVKVLGIYGSPRQGGNSDLLLDKVLEGARLAGAEIKSVFARDLKILGCLECGGCDETGECIVDDRMQEVYPLLEWADVIIFGSPIFFYGPPAQAKALIDRGQAMWNRRLLRKDKSEWKNYESGIGYLVAVGATKGKNLFEGAQLTAKYFYDALDMDYGGGLFFRGIDGKGAIADDPEPFDQALEFGRRVVEENQRP